MIQNPSIFCSIPPDDGRRYSFKIRHCTWCSFQEKDCVMLGVQTESSQCESIEGLLELAHCTQCSVNYHMYLSLRLFQISLKSIQSKYMYVMKLMVSWIT